ncbi:hypothetical protein KIH39_22975 [Telmatocola sphagniphila]|uniref:Uncharacterized protein n=1 Tax=Telmatocola sphagniphila TaxID=1123043 RepID=A0A8E6B4D1_9BACT|nr:hypothetical protein [Telmatocola sphagniphila]QVL31677.1 hypothetical protein KIH39_22975 [Telmatocola sphagniphila]
MGLGVFICVYAGIFGKDEPSLEGLKVIGSGEKYSIYFTNVPLWLSFVNRVFLILALEALLTSIFGSGFLQLADNKSFVLCCWIIGPPVAILVSLYLSPSRLVVDLERKTLCVLNKYSSYETIPLSWCRSIDVLDESIIKSDRSDDENIFRYIINLTWHDRDGTSCKLNLKVYTDSALAQAICEELKAMIPMT